MKIRWVVRWPDLNHEGRGSAMWVNNLHESGSFVNDRRPRRDSDRRNALLFATKAEAEAVVVRIRDAWGSMSTTARAVARRVP